MKVSLWTECPIFSTDMKNAIPDLTHESYGHEVNLIVEVLLWCMSNRENTKCIIDICVKRGTSTKIILSFLSLWVSVTINLNPGFSLGQSNDRRPSSHVSQVVCRWLWCTGSNKCCHIPLRMFIWTTLFGPSMYTNIVVLDRDGFVLNYPFRSLSNPIFTLYSPTPIHHSLVKRCRHWKRSNFDFTYPLITLNSWDSISPRYPS